MHFASLLLVPVTLLAGLTSAAPLDLDKRVGPSGQVITPAGGTTYSATQGYPTAKIDFSYKPVYINKQNNCGYYGCTAQTWYVSVGLRDSKGQVTMLAQTLGADQLTENIEATLVVPANMCGSYNLQVTEYQNLYNQQISFIAAAPKININCSPLP